MYSGTVADFSATDSLIYRGELRTEQYDYKHLNGESPETVSSRRHNISRFYPSTAPDFVNALEDEDHVYFFFREAAVEFINCGKVSGSFQMQPPIAPNGGLISGTVLQPTPFFGPFFASRTRCRR